MKKFMSSQKFFEKVDDEVVFTLEYTQELEILPFIKRWLPDLIILEPKELKDRLDEDLRIISLLDVYIHHLDIQKFLFFYILFHPLYSYILGIFYLLV
jgi:hypothetical protein